MERETTFLPGEEGKEAKEEGDEGEERGRRREGGGGGGMQPCVPALWGQRVFLDRGLPPRQHFLEDWA